MNSLVAGYWTASLLTVTSARMRKTFIKNKIKLVSTFWFCYSATENYTTCFKYNFTYCFTAFHLYFTLISSLLLKTSPQKKITSAVHKIPQKHLSSIDYFCSTFLRLSLSLYLSTLALAASDFTSLSLSRWRIEEFCVDRVLDRSGIRLLKPSLSSSTCFSRLWMCVSSSALQPWTSDSTSYIRLCICVGINPTVVHADPCSEETRKASGHIRCYFVKVLIDCDRKMMRSLASLTLQRSTSVFPWSASILFSIFTRRNLGTNLLMLLQEISVRSQQTADLIFSPSHCDLCKSSFIWGLSVLLVDGQKQLPLMHADSCVVSFSWQLSVFVDKPSLSQHICCWNFYLLKGCRKSLWRDILSLCTEPERKHCYLLHMLSNTHLMYLTQCTTITLSHTQL